MSTLIGGISVSHANGEPEDMDPDTIGGYDDTWLPLRLLVASSGARFFFRTGLARVISPSGAVAQADSLWSVEWRRMRVEDNASDLMDRVVDLVDRHAHAVLLPTRRHGGRNGERDDATI
jgi:hypothetical protein